MIKKYGGKVTQSVGKKTSYVIMGQDPGESKLSKVHCNAQLKTGKEKKKTARIISECMRVRKTRLLNVRKTRLVNVRKCSLVRHEKFNIRPVVCKKVTPHVPHSRVSLKVH